MLNKGPLWKNIGKQDSLKQFQSSVSLSGNKPIKTFQITFEQEKPSKYQSQTAKKNNNSPLKQAQNSIIQQQQLDVSPMIITQDQGYKRQRNEEVLQVISFNSSDHGKVTNMNHILSMDEIDEINEEQFHKNSKILERSSSLPYKENQEHVIKDHRNKIIKAFNTIKLLKEDVQVFRIYLADVFSNWQIQAIKTCNNIKDQMNEKISKISSQVKVVKPLSRNLQIEEWSKRYTVLQQQILIVNRNLQLQKTSKQALKKENIELQQKLRKSQRSQKEQRNKMSCQLTLSQQHKNRIKKLQYQLSDLKLQSQSHTSKVSKLKQVIKQKEMYIRSQGEELSQQQKQIKQLKISNQQSFNRERKYQIQIKSLRERIQREHQAQEKEISKGKLQLAKFKNLLKNSEEQLSQCEEYINKLNSQMKDTQADKLKLQQTIKQNQIQYIKKLQQCDKYLNQLENNLKQQTVTNQYREQNFKSKEMELFRIKQDFQNKMIQLSNKEYELQQIKKQFQQKTLYMQRREDQLKYQYNNAINVQNAVKDKWYERYYSILSPEKYKDNNMTPQRDINPLSPRSSLARRQIFDIPPIRETKSPVRDKFIKVRSERNINTYRSDVPIVTARNQFQRNDSQKQIINLGSRINSLRRQLTKQLGQIGLNS